MMEGSGDASVMVFDMAMDQVVVPVTMEDHGAANQFLSKTANNLGSELMLLWQSESFMDVDLICAGNQTVRTHRVILAALSPFFRKIFMDWGPAMETDINIVLAEVQAQTIRDFLQKIYQGDLSLAVIDPSLAHLHFDGEALKEPVRSVVAVADLITKAAASIIKSEPASQIPNFFLEQAATNKKDHEKIKEEQDLDDDYDPSSEHLSSSVVAAGGLSATTVKSKKSKVWNFFTRLEKDVARCKSCEVTIKTQKGNTTGMTRHLFRAHSELYNQLEIMKQKDNDSHDNSEDDDDDEDFSPFKGISLKVSGRKRKKGQSSGKSTRKRANQKRSKVWQFFDQQADGTEARCNACLIMIKTDMGNTSGLISHLRSSHPEQFEELSALREGGGDEQSQAGSTAGARNSPVWQFYEELGSNRVKCIKCNVVLKYYYGTTSGLLRHLRRSHAEAYDAIKNDDNSAGNANNADGNAAAADTLDVDNETIWKFFHKSENNDSANCVDCMLEVTNQHGSLVTSCEEHLRGSHTDLLEQYESQRKAYVQELIKSDKTAIKRRYTSRVVASAIWSFFKKTETDSSSHNQCLTCLVEIDCSQNTTAMVKHLEDTHPEQHESFKKQSGIDAKDIKVPSAIWKHFLRTEDPKKHKCIACEKEILCHFQTTSNMIRHLEHNHTNLYEEFLRESHGLEQSDQVNPLLKKPKKRNINMKGSNDPADRTCPDCGKEYSCRPAMLFHYKCVHSGIRPYKCEECGMTFARQDSWKGHTHSKVRSFLCSICGKTFARRNIRDTHERAHLNDRRYPCSYCGKKFMTNQQRTNHERTHTGEKPFQCTDCGRQFAQQHQLTTHTRIHTGEKPYSCQHCGQKFRHLSSRNNHKCDGKTASSAVAQISVSWNN